MPKAEQVKTIKLEETVRKAVVNGITQAGPQSALGRCKCAGSPPIP